MGSDQSKSLDKTIFDMRLTTKQLMRMSKKAEASKKHEEKEVAKALKTGRREIAKIHAENAIRHKTSSLNFLRLSSRIDAVVQKLQSAQAMKKLTPQMSRVVQGMHATLENMNPEKINTIMEKFEKLSEDLEVTEAAMTDGVGAATASGAPIDEIDELMNRVADEQNIEMAQDLPAASESTPVSMNTNVAAVEKGGQIGDRS